MLRVTLTAEDLDLVQVASRPAPLLELRTALREPLVERPGSERAEHRSRVELARSLVAHPCAPGFLFSAVSDPDEAIDMVVGTRRDVIRRDLEDNSTAGFPLPEWSVDLTRPGHVGTRTRTALLDALAHVASTYIAPRTRLTAPLVTARTRAWEKTAASRGSQAMLNSLHPGIRCRGAVLEIDLGSGAEVQAATTGSGIRVVPTLSPWPGATVSSDGGSPLVLTCPVAIPAEPAFGIHPGGDRALEQLIGPNRSTLLRVIATHPGLGTRQLARLSGLAPASVSDHTKVLRTAGLTTTTADGARTTHAPTALGWALLLGGADTLDTLDTLRRTR